jgi:hypothetical protein
MILDDQRVAPRKIGRHLAHAQLALDSAEVRVELLGGELLEPEALPPDLEHGQRCAEAGARVDQRRAADVRPERQQYRHVPSSRHLARVAIRGAQSCHAGAR